jgi:hypothetical protein
MKANAPCARSRSWYELPVMDTNQFADGLRLPFGFSSGSLFASLVWGAVGAGFCIYGKKQRSAPALFGGIALVGISYFINSALWMSVAAVGIIAGIWLWSRQG